MPFSLKASVDEELDQLESEGIIYKVGHSAWAAPIVIVPKADKSVSVRGLQVNC